MAELRMAHFFRIFLVLLSALLCCFGVAAGVSVCRNADRDALLLFKGGLVDYQGVLSSWDPAVSCCEWLGVACNPAGEVTEVVVDDTSSTGLEAGLWLERSGNDTRPDLIGRSLGTLKSLQLLKLAHMDLHADVFPEAFLTAALGVLALPGLNLFGPIPTQWGSLSHLRYLNLSSNAGFTGGLPVQICRLSELQVMDLALANDAKGILTGHIPTCLGSLAKLSTLVLSFNGLSGSIPALGRLANLKVLKIDHNKLSGGIPAFLGSLSKLQVLHLQGNVGLSGQIPKTLSRLVHLQDLRLGGSDGGGRGDDFVGISDDLDSEAKGLTGFLSVFLPLHSAELRVLHIRGTAVSGSIPASMGKLSQLVDLRLDYNQLHGSIPPSFGELKNLEQLFLRYNTLSGNIPSSMGLLRNIQNLHLNRNFLTGPIPAAFVRLSFTTINLSYNKLAGHIPVGLGSIANSSGLLSRALDLSNNILSGPFPISLVTSGLSSIRLSHNMLSSLPPGNLSVGVAQASSLASLYLDQNRLTGLIPPWILELKSLNVLDLSNNMLRSPFPSFSASSLTLTYLNLSKNLFSGRLPQELSNFVGLALLDLSDNAFDGPIPPNIGGTLTAAGDVSNLEILDLSNNRLTGGLPAGIFSVLQGLRLSKNRLNGLILGGENGYPSVSFKLLYLDLSDNEFSGPIPPQIGTSTTLNKVMLAGNRLSGPIPDLSFSCRRAGLRVISLADNKLTGPAFPSAVLKGCTNVELYDVSGNHLTGSLPAELKSWQALRVLDIGKNQLSGVFPDWIVTLPALQYLDVSHNKFSGRLPLGRYNAFPGIENANRSAEEVGELGPLFSYLEWNMDMLTVTPTLDFSGNLFTGQIPPSTGKLRNLVKLNLARNQISGPIPASLSEISQLMSLDVSHNKLVSHIPAKLTRLRYLTSVNFSYNNLSGPIPQSSGWSTFPASSFIGNKLCGHPLTDRCEA